MTRLVIPGPFTARRLDDGWLITAAGGAEVLLREVAPEESSRLAAGFAALDLEWGADNVTVTIRREDREVRLLAGSAVVHEPQPLLYESLPLAGFDAAAKTFWRRIFTLIRIPGGRLLVRLIARRRRGGPAAG
jgi:hypothetical protein